MTTTIFYLRIIKAIYPHLIMTISISLHNTKLDLQMFFLTTSYGSWSFFAFENIFFKKKKYKETLWQSSGGAQVIWWLNSSLDMSFNLLFIHSFRFHESEKEIRSHPLNETEKKKNIEAQKELIYTIYTYIYNGNAKKCFFLLFSIFIFSL